MEKQLLAAARDGRLDDVKRLLDDQVPVDCVDEEHCTPLFLAAEGGHVTVASLLIENGANMDARDNEDTTVLMFAAMNGHNRVVQLLVNQGAAVNAVDKNPYTALLWAMDNGHSTTAQLLISLGAEVNPSDKDKWSPLVWAATKGHYDWAQMLIDNGADVNAADNDTLTPLMWTALYGPTQVVELLVKAGAIVDATTGNKQTALMFAAESGREDIVQALIARGASIDAANYKRQTAMILAASEGYKDVVRILLGARASLVWTDAHEESALMYAIDGNRVDVVRELFNVDSGIDQTMALLKLGLQKRRHDAGLKKKTTDQVIAEVKLDDLTQLCAKMQEAQTISERIYFRLVDLETQLVTLNAFAAQEATPRYKQLVNKIHDFLSRNASKHTVTRLVGSQVVIGSLRDLNRELDAFLLQFNILSEKSQVHDWEKQWDQDLAVFKLLLHVSMNKSDVLATELQDPRVQREALTLLMFECDHHASHYSSEELQLINNIFHDVSSMSQLQIESVPKWFVPPHEVEFNASTSFARGSYGSIHLGTWNGTAVVIKLAFSKDEKSRKMFLNETEIWFKLKHPHIVTLFRACHVGNPFFVCDWASNGTLSDYLYRHENRFETWAKLHEAAMGLEYLHTKQKVVHGDLKCNNILIGSDDKAKLTDFGLSFVLENGREDLLPQDIGAINWKAPEVINGNTRGSFASDIYSFGMCIIEAVTGRLPWGMIPDVAVKHKTQRERALPNQPSEMNDAQWDLVKRMCAWDPADRMSVSEAVKILLNLASEELNQKAEAEWAEYMND